MTPKQLYTNVVVPGCDLLAELGGPPRDGRADVLLVAISGQEANWTAQRQHGGGPAHGLWQFERMGGVAGVLTHRSSRGLARKVCDHLGVLPQPTAVHKALANSGAEADLLDCCFARLLLWTDPRPLPGTQWAAWDYYLDNWRPGKPHRDRWPTCYKEALYVVEKAKDET